MKRHLNALIRLILCVLTALLVLCSCGSELDGTWTSQNNKSTKIKFSGDKVKISADGFKINGTYEVDEDDHIILDLTDANGDKYRITAVLSVDKKRETLILTNANGDQEVFAK